MIGLEGMAALGAALGILTMAWIFARLSPPDGGSADGVSVGDIRQARTSLMRSDTPWGALIAKGAAARRMIYGAVALVSASGFVFLAHANRLREIADWEAKLNAQTARFRQLEAQLNETQRSLTEARDAADRAGDAGLEARLESVLETQALKDEIDELEDAVDERDDRIEELEEELEALRGQRGERTRF
ncbi:MAG: hypothetical protein ACFB2Z_04285 [Maricaulaceae bacterium]